MFHYWLKWEQARIGSRPIKNYLVNYFCALFFNSCCRINFIDRFYVKLLFFSFFSDNGDSSKACNDRNVEPKVVPPACIVYFINSDIGLKEAPNQRYRSNPSVPYTPEKTGRIFWGVSSSTGNATGN